MHISRYHFPEALTIAHTHPLNQFNRYWKLPRFNYLKCFTAIQSFEIRVQRARMTKVWYWISTVNGDGPSFISSWLRSVSLTSSSLSRIGNHFKDVVLPSYEVLTPFTIEVTDFSINQVFLILSVISSVLYCDYIDRTNRARINKILDNCDSKWNTVCVMWRSLSLTG
jgi:hypothetical protein